jgi:hypothetical protein
VVELREIDVKKSPKLKKKEAGTITLELPETEQLKTLKINTPDGVVSTSGDEMLLAPKMKSIDIPIFIEQRAPEEFEIEFDLMEEKDMPDEEKLSVKKKHSMKLLK